MIKEYAQKIGIFSRLIIPYGKTETDDLIKFITFKYWCSKIAEDDMNVNNIIKEPKKCKTINNKFNNSKIKLIKIVNNERKKICFYNIYMQFL